MFKEYRKLHEDFCANRERFADLSQEQSARELQEEFSTIIKTAFDSKEENKLRNFKAFSTYNDVAELVYDAVFDD